ncbi:hypothetical protein [Shewanella surugensis]|uniref:Uncharacterized protein n=1 Tax=Shewanella surugensis TaxID=212020 RepID=A0ABT0LJT0_9GAMM|nr:hypothetical protein [Shewanella surugensis]MCL1127972.1 hypothetical protein [Shewanella surugensis]
MSYNLMRVFEEISKIQDPELIDPSDEKYTKELKVRDSSAKTEGDLLTHYFLNQG